MVSFGHPDASWGILGGRFRGRAGGKRNGRQFPAGRRAASVRPGKGQGGDYLRREERRLADPRPERRRNHCKTSTVATMTTTTNKQATR